jgi:hypothetical protein
MLKHRRFNKLEIVRHFDSDFTGYQYNMKSTTGYIFMLTE